MSEIIDNYVETSGFVYASVYGGDVIYQSFKPRNNYVLTSCSFFLRKDGSPTENVVAKLYAHTGTFGTTSEPTGEALATSAVLDIATLSDSSGSFIEFTFSSEVILVKDVPYIILAEYAGGDMDNSLFIGMDYTSPSHEGNIGWLFEGDYVPETAYDALFYVYGDKLAPTVDSKYPLPPFSVG